MNKEIKHHVAMVMQPSLHGHSKEPSNISITTSHHGTTAEQILFEYTQKPISGLVLVPKEY